ncbi:MAG TPA: glycosyl hydrolase [Opitutus sp.]|nr:glycosyl hydrolase [Opitutus sp.]
MSRLPLRLSRFAVLAGVLALAGAPRGTAAAVFGAMTHFAQGWNTKLVHRLTAAGIAHVRDELYWDTVEPQPGVFRFPAAYDAYMSALHAAGISPLIELTFANPNYDGGHTPYTPAGFAAYARYATAVLQRYGAQIHAVEVWNEYNGTWCNGPATADRAGTYTRMLATAYAAIKAARPDVTVVGGATAGLPLPYLERLFADGALRSMDAVSIHPYRTDSPPEGLEIQVAALRQLIDRYAGGRTIPIWVTEIGWGTHAPAAPGDLDIDRSTQAKFLVRALTLLASAGVDRTYWYLARDDHNTPTMGLVNDNRALTPKLAARAMATLNAQLGNATFVRREPAAAGIYSLLFHDPAAGDLRVLWSLHRFTLTVAPETRLTSLYGAAIAPAADGTIVVGDAPVFMAGLLPALPAANATGGRVAAESLSGFSDQQGRNGWSYGAFIGDNVSFVPLARYAVTDWNEQWTDVFPYLSITAGDQHPSHSGPAPVAAVRRWTSDFAGTVHVTGRFKCTPHGDGVGVRVLADGQPLYAADLGGGRSIVGTFDLQPAVRVGTTLDFVVDPGPAANIDYDATEVSVVVEQLSP